MAPCGEMIGNRALKVAAVERAISGARLNDGSSFPHTFARSIAPLAPDMPARSSKKSYASEDSRYGTISAGSSSFGPQYQGITSEVRIRRPDATEEPLIKRRGSHDPGASRLPIASWK